MRAKFALSNMLGTGKFVIVMWLVLLVQYGMGVKLGWFVLYPSSTEVCQLVKFYMRTLLRTFPHGSQTGEAACS